MSGETAVKTEVRKRMNRKEYAAPVLKKREKLSDLARGASTVVS